MRTKKLIALFSALTMLAALAGCNNEEVSSSESTKATLSEENKNAFEVDERYEFHEMLIHVADEWTTEEDDNTLTVTCEESLNIQLCKCQ